MWSATSDIVPRGAALALSQSAIAFAIASFVSNRACKASSAAVLFASHSGYFGETNSQIKFTCTTPPFSGIICNTSSGTQRGCGSMANALECEKITGARETCNVSRIVSALTCEMSANMPEPVHFSHHAPPEFGQSVMLHAVRRRVGPVDIVPMRQGHVARAHFVKNTQRCRRIFDHVPAFHAQQAGDAPELVYALDIICGPRLFKFLTAADEAQRHIKFAQRLMQRGVGLLRTRIHIDRPVLCSHASFTQPRNICAKSRLNLAHIELRQIAGTGFQQH